jgi:capsular polysaccharide biosynthesis protein
MTDNRLVRVLLLSVLIGALVGAVVGVVRAAAQPDAFRAESTLAVGQGAALFPTDPKVQAARPVTETLARLVRSRVVAQNVVANLRLEGVTADELLDRLHVRTSPGSNLVTIAVDDSDAQRAARIAQETALVFSQLVKERFGSVTTQQPPQLPLTATIFDPAETGRKVGGDPARDGAVGAAVGALLGALVGGLLLVRRRPRRVQLPEDLVASLESRERELAAARAELASVRATGENAVRELAAERRAHEAAAASGEQAAGARAEAERLREELAAARAEAERLREELDGLRRASDTQTRDDDDALARRTEAITARELQAARTHAQLVVRARELDERESALAAREEERTGELQAAPVTVTAAVDPAPTPARERAANSGVTLAELERLVREQRAEHPDRAEDWAFYLVYLREHADATGRLPESFDWLLDDVFGELLAARRP